MERSSSYRNCRLCSRLPGTVPEVPSKHKRKYVLDPCCEPYAQPSSSLAFYTGSKKAAHYKVIRWLLSFAVEGSQSLLTSVWTRLASCKSLSLVNLFRPLHWFWFLRGIHIQLKPLKLIPVIDAWLDKVLRRDSIQYTCNVKIWFIYLLFSETIF